MEEKEGPRCRERMQQVHRFYHWRGVFADMRSVCGVRWAWRITAGLCHTFLVLP